jgi:DNA-binding GntR family transcriptional regulator
MGRQSIVIKSRLDQTFQVVSKLQGSICYNFELAAAMREVDGRVPMENDEPKPNLALKVGRAHGSGGPPGETDNTRAYTALKQAVLSGSFRPGELVTLRALGTRLEIGDTPVREAIKRLISEGAFEGLPNRSARVPLLDRREIQQILDLRILLESNAAALAAQNITLHQIEQLRSFHRAMDAAVAANDSSEYGKFNMAFHFEIYRIADNKTLATLIEALWLRMAPFVSRSRSLIESDVDHARHLACDNHEAILAAMQARDAGAAQLAMREDLSALSRIDGYWEGIGEAPLK